MPSCRRLRRWLRRAAAPAAIFAWTAATLASPAAALAAERWPTMALDDGWQGPGFYLGPVKLGLALTLFLVWVWCADWINRDALRHKLRHLRANMLVFFSFFAAMLLLWIAPAYLLVLPLLVAALAGPVGWYVVHRNGLLPADEQVLTPLHFRRVAAEWLGMAGITIRVEPPGPDDRGPPLKLFARSDDLDERVEREAEARQTVGYVEGKRLLAAALDRRAAALVAEETDEAVSLRHQIDGVWIDADPLELERTRAALASLMTLAGIDAEDRRPSQGGFVLEYRDARATAAMNCEGPRTTIHFRPPRGLAAPLDVLGVRPKVEEQLLELLGRQRGMVLFAALPGGGLRSTLAAALRALDRLQRDFVSIQPADYRDEEVENIAATTYGRGQSPAALLPKLFRNEPDVVVAPELGDGPAATALCRTAARERLVIASIRAREAAEAPLRLAALGVTAADAAAALSGIVYQRLIRRLCDDCKEGYEPAESLLDRLGIPRGRVTELYRPPEQPKRKCPACGGIGYQGRTALVQLLVVDDAVRKAIGGMQLEVIRRAAAAAGMHSLGEEGSLLVVRGVTSAEELLRVLK